MSAPKRRHVLAGVDGDPTTGIVTYHYNVIRADDEDDHPTVLRTYSREVRHAPDAGTDGP